MGNVRERSASGPFCPGPTRRPAGAPSGPDILRESIRKTVRLSSVCALAAGGLLHAFSAQAVEFSSGELQGSFDTTLSHGVTFRTGKRDDSLTGLNSDDGGRNYHRGLVSNTSKVTGELELDYRNFGAFARFNGFIDFENENGRRARTPPGLSEKAKDLAGKDLEILDLYVTGAFEAGDDTPVDVRLGNHVLNWGESTFIQNGVNVVNPFDVTKLRTPGAELRDALEPVPLVSASVAPTSALSLEGFYQFDWKKTEIDPPGTYFSTNDYVGAGGEWAYLSSDAFASIVTDMGGPTRDSPLYNLIARGPSMPTSQRSPRRPREWPWRWTADPRAPVLHPPLPERIASPPPTPASSAWNAGRTVPPMTRASGGSRCATSPRT